jgi:tetratricopeptide (TPR) repeat protein
MRKEFVVVLLALATAIAPASAQMAVRGAGIYQNGIAGQTGYGTAPQENDYANGRRLIHFGKYAEAIPFLNSAHLEQPHNADILAFLGYAHHMTGDNDLALDLYKVALQENPDHLLAHEYLGELYLSLNYLPPAQEQLARLDQLCPSGCDERDALAKAIATFQASASATPPPKSPN